MIDNLLGVYLIHLSYFALVFIPVISSLGFPFSEELMLLGAGYLAAIGFIRWDLGLMLVFIGVIAGDNSAYFIGRQGGRLFDLIVSERKLKKAQRYTDKHGAKTVFIARFIPGMRWLVPIIAGASKMKYKKFFLYNTLGAVLVVPIIMSIGYYVGTSLEQIIIFTQDLNAIIFIAALVLISVASIFVCCYRRTLRQKLRESSFFDRWLKKGEEPYQVVTLGNPKHSARQIIAKIRKKDGKVNFLIGHVKDGSVKKFIKLKQWLSLKRYQAFLRKWTKARQHKIEKWD
jgi:membrane-associated protein